MKDVVFLAPYPSDDIIKDGMIQRVRYIDNLFCGERRCYMNISLFRYSRKSEIIHSTTVKEYKLNMILHFIFILKLLRSARAIYIHSIYRAFHILFQFPFVNSPKYLDVHGVVPEENLLVYGRTRYLLYQAVEWLSFKYISCAIFVTKAMQTHYERKYRWYDRQKVVFNIYPNVSEVSLVDINCSGNVKVIYSGNTQKWQNIEDMLMLMNKRPSYEYVVLTGEPEEFRRLVRSMGLEIDNLTIRTVLPEELPNYYREAHYGFILRDDLIINRVANPTKMIEYLAFGIIPIVRLSEIGDFYDRGYEYLSEEQFESDLRPKKSVKNNEIARDIASENYSTSLYELVVNGQS